VSNNIILMVDQGVLFFSKCFTTFYESTIMECLFLSEPVSIIEIKVLLYIFQLFN